RRADRRHLPCRRRSPCAADRAVRDLCRDGAGAGIPSLRPVHPGPAAEDLKMWSRQTLAGALAFLVLAAAAPFAPAWLVPLATIPFANGLVVLGLVILWRAGLVPFGQALYYATGAYTVALLGRYTGLHDIFVLSAAGALAAGLVAFLTGFLLARYRDIFFAML